MLLLQLNYAKPLVPLHPVAAPRRGQGKGEASTVCCSLVRSVTVYILGLLPELSRASRSVTASRGKIYSLTLNSRKPDSLLLAWSSACSGEGS